MAEGPKVGSISQAAGAITVPKVGGSTTGDIASLLGGAVARATERRRQEEMMAMERAKVAVMQEGVQLERDRLDYDKEKDPLDREIERKRVDNAGMASEAQLIQAETMAEKFKEDNQIRRREADAARSGLANRGYKNAMKMSDEEALQEWAFFTEMSLRRAASAGVAFGPFYQALNTEVGNARASWMTLFDRQREMQEIRHGVEVEVRGRFTGPDGMVNRALTMVPTRTGGKVPFEKASEEEREEFIQGQIDALTSPDMLQEMERLGPLVDKAYEDFQNAQARMTSLVSSVGPEIGFDVSGKPTVRQPPGMQGGAQDRVAPRDSTLEAPDGYTPPPGIAKPGALPGQGGANISPQRMTNRTIMSATADVQALARTAPKALLQYYPYFKSLEEQLDGFSVDEALMSIGMTIDTLSGQVTQAEETAKMVMSPDAGAPVQSVLTRNVQSIGDTLTKDADFSLSPEEEARRAVARRQAAERSAAISEFNELVSRYREKGSEGGVRTSEIVERARRLMDDYGLTLPQVLEATSDKSVRDWLYSQLPNRL